MDVPIKHIIGTVALIGLVAMTAMAYTIITSYIESDVKKQQLKQIAENVALNLVEMANLVNFENLFADRNVTKTIDVPTDLGGNVYLIELMNGIEEGQGFYVHAYLLTKNEINAHSPIPLNSNSTELLISTYNQVYSGSGELVVWARKKAVEQRIVTEAGIAGGF